MAGMESPQIKLLNLLLAVPLFGLSAVALVKHIRYVEFVEEMTAQGHFVCGLGHPGLMPCALLGSAGAMILLGRYWAAGVLVGLAIYLAAPWLF